MDTFWAILIDVGVYFVLGAGIYLLARIFWPPLHTAAREAALSKAKREFHIRRERLEAKFATLALTKSSYRKMDWDECRFDDDVSYVRNRNSGELAALVAVAVPEIAATPADEFPDYIDDPQPIERKNGTAVFRFHRGHWMTDGHVILNLTPSEAILAHLQELEIVDKEFSHRHA